MMRRPFYVLLAASLVGAAGHAFAGGYLAVSAAGVPFKWTASPIVVRLDQGTLGAKTNGDANTLTQAGLNAWTDANNTISFSIGAQLPVDNNGTALPFSAPQFDEVAPDSINPVIYDTDGSITDFALGSGASNSVIGFAGPAWTSGTTITEGQAVLNGKFLATGNVPPDLTDLTYQGVITHEIGHMLNLDHTQFNDYLCNQYTNAGASQVTRPTMYPIVGDGNTATPEFDDLAWLGNLYPSAAFTSGTYSITGIAKTSAGANLNGVNMIARRADDANKTVAVACVSGFLDGTPTASPDGAYTFPGLPTGTNWVVTMEPIKSSFTGGSGVGPIDPPIDLPGPAEYVNEAAVEGNADTLNVSTTWNATTGAQSFTFNSSFPNTAVSEVDGGRDINAAQSITVTPGNRITITGSATSAESTGTAVDVAGDPIEDWYYLRVATNAAAAKISRITLTDNTAGSDFDLYVASWDVANSQLFFPVVGLTAGNGPGLLEDGYPLMDTSLTGSGGAAGRIYIGVSHFTSAGPGGSYTVTVDTTASEAEMVAVDTLSGFVGNTLTITGRGFKNSGGNPTVTFSDPDISVGAVTFTNSTQITVATTLPGGPGTLDSSVTVQVTNSATSGSYAGRKAFAASSGVTGWQLLD
ncbi:hypothetical protein BH09SUM1_BH09SUM1_24680 [soil metagenome]